MAMKAQICDKLSRNLEEREEGERERKVASDYELNFRYFNADAFEVFEKMYELAFGQEAGLIQLCRGSSQCLCSCCRENLSNDQEGLTLCF
ncbi:hypothetical protein RGQ29_024007 [Quercus rubra]|uniref:Uncharacterized protein n=1 Tax=Quercus rubra TaxID=3512 RepID=A0AAN7F653_QUERU|nr:hypothetical protein RGQ29_024007 [Quercus rubra]